MIRRRFLHVAVLALAAALRPARAQDPRASAAVAAARDWLLMADHGDAAESHKRAGARFRSAMNPGEWQAVLARERTPRGAVVQRTLQQTDFRKSLAAGVDGEFALLQFRTAFAKQTDAGETLTLEREADGAWRVIGYFIR